VNFLAVQYAPGPNIVMTSPTLLPAVDLVEAGLLPPLVRALLEGRDHDLLEPLTLGLPGSPLPAPRPVDRRRLAAELAQANASYGHPRAAELARKLADPATRVVVTGQQPGLFGGPLYTLTKALAASKWAAAIEARGEPAVALFWMATEDHDYAEVAQSTLLTAQGPLKVTLGEDPSPLVPVGMRTLGPQVETALADLGAALQGGCWAEALAAVGGWYRPEARFGEAFARLLAHLLGPRCPLLLDAMLPALKAAEAPHLGRLVARRGDIERGLDRTDERLRQRGYTPQVERHPGASQLFVLQGEARRRVLWSGEAEYALRGVGEARALADLEARIAENPAAVSPGALARPAIQDAVLGSAVFIVGPGELAYLAQAALVYAVLEVPPPLVALRPQALVLEGHQPEHLLSWGGRLEALLAEDADLDRLVSGGSGAALARPARERIAEALAELRPPALELDPTLERPFEKTRETVERALEAFAQKLEAAAARRDETTRARLLRLRAAVRPAGGLQERVLSSLQFPGKYGPEFVERFAAALELDPRRLQIVTLE
jgi:bacillithiol biosynthesis cysteine-adding enzyme BshC